MMWGIVGGVGGLKTVLRFFLAGRKMSEVVALTCGISRLARPKKEWEENG